jgi:hypothetical protein
MAEKEDMHRHMNMLMSQIDDNKKIQASLLEAIHNKGSSSLEQENEALLGKNEDL